MTAIVATRAGGPEVLRLEQVPEPEPAPREVLVRVRASGVNRADTLQRRGLYPPPPGASEVLGLEFAGVVERAGADVTRWRSGDRVMGIVAGGGCAEKVVVDERVAVPVPDGMAMEEAGAIPEVFMTAHDAVFLQGGLRGAGDPAAAAIDGLGASARAAAAPDKDPPSPPASLLIHAVGSGVGTAALQLARRAGAFTIGTSRTASKLARAAALGLDVGLDGGGEWDRAVREATGGRGADVILDLVGAPYLARNQAAVAVGGTHMVVGVPGGMRAELDLRLLMTRRARMAGTVLRARSVEQKAALARDFTGAVLPGFADGALAPVLDSVLPATSAAEAHRRVEANETFGKIVLTWDG